MRRLVLLTAAVGLVVGCGDEKEGGGSTDTSSIDGKKISELKGTELKTLCDWMVAQDKKTTITDDQYCTADAAGWSETKEECEEYKDECLADLEVEEESDDCEDFNVTKACSAVVKDLKACFSDLYKDADAAARKASCDKPGEGGIDKLPDSCAGLEDCVEVDVSFGSLTKR